MRKLLIIPMLVFALFVGFSTPARATPPTVGSGTFTDSNFTVTPIRQGDGKFISASFTEALTGILAGSCAVTLTEVFHADGTGNFSGSQTCTGAVGSQAGAYSFSFVGTQAANGSLQGSFVLSGTGTLANVHGQGTFQGSALTGMGTYTAQVHFDP